MLLPKGIVTNSSEVEGSIDRIDDQPLDQADIAKLWKVYTTTQRRLLDPTAERLENLWWRIWGSRRKQLKGAIVARLFAQISEGQSFKPLRGPSNRDEEGASPASTSVRSGASSTITLHRHISSRPDTISSTVSKAPVPMPHPILKKTRGPSTTGPRPTARFISPHESQDESDSTSLVSPNTHVVVQPPSGPSSPSIDLQESKCERRSTVLSKKKSGFVASAGKKRRPMIVRRPSSQTSQSSTDGAPKIYDVGMAGVQSSYQRTPVSFAEETRKSQSRFQENFSPSSNHSNTGEQSARKRITPRAADATISSPRSPSREQKVANSLSEIASTGDPGPSRQFNRAENHQEPDHNPIAHEMGEFDVQRALFEEAKARKGAVAGRTARESRKYSSRALQNSHRSISEGKLSSEGKSKAVLAPNLTAACGQMELGDKDSGVVPLKSRSSASLHKGKGRESVGLRHTDMFAKRPVQPSVVAPDTSRDLVKSKSQLTMLLERDRKRNGEKKPEYSNGQKGSSKGAP